MDGGIMICVPIGWREIPWLISQALNNSDFNHFRIRPLGITLDYVKMDRFYRTGYISFSIPVPPALMEVDVPDFTALPDSAEPEPDFEDIPF